MVVQLFGSCKVVIDTYRSADDLIFRFDFGGRMGSTDRYLCGQAWNMNSVWGYRIRSPIETDSKKCKAFQRKEGSKQSNMYMLVSLSITALV